MSLYPDDNGTSVGPMQLNAPFHLDALSAVVGYEVVVIGDAMRLLRDPATNIAAAWLIYKDQGWAPWSCQP